MKRYPYTVELSVDGADWPYEVIINKDHTGDLVIFRGVINISEKRQLAVSHYFSKCLWQENASRVCEYAEKTILKKLGDALKKWIDGDEA